MNSYQRAAAWFRDSSLAVVAVLLVLAVAGSGWSASFISLHQFATAHMGLSSGAAWLVPSTFDGAALGLSLLAFRAATFGRASLGSRLYVYGFTALSSWINYIHIPDPQGRIVACLLPIAAVVVFDKVLKEAREAYERRNGKKAFRVRPGLLMLRLLIDRRATKAAIKAQITAIPVEALIGLGAGDLARDATALGVPGGTPATQAQNVPATVPGTAPRAHRTTVPGTVPAAGQSALVIPQVRRARKAITAVPDKPKTGSEYATEAELRARALEIDDRSMTEDGRAAGVRKLREELGIGAEKATRLRDWLAAQREQLDTVTHANGTEY